MKLAVNFSNPLIRLLKEGEIEIDLIKCPDWEGMLKEAEPYSPITIHYDLTAGLSQTFNVDFERIRRFKEQTQTPHYNTHLVTPRNFDLNKTDALVRINHLWREEISRMVSDFGAEAVVLEHYPYTANNAHIAPAADTVIFSRVILDTGCQLLLDLAHARITADTLGTDVKDYIRALPLDRLREMHITGLQNHGGVLTDHFELNQEDWEIFDWAMGEIRTGHWREPEIIAFEYGGVGETFVWRTDYDVLRNQVPRLFEIVHK